MPHPSKKRNQDGPVQDADWDDDSFLLTTLAGTVIQMQVPVSIHHTWEMLEEYLVEHLPRNSLIETFGCELTLINADTQIALQDPIQEDLWKNNHFSLVVHDCFRMLQRQQASRGSTMRTNQESRPVGCGWFCLVCCWVVFVLFFTI